MVTTPSLVFVFQAAGMDNLVAAETACLSGGEVAAELKMAGSFGKTKVTKAPGRTGRIFGDFR